MIIVDDGSTDGSYELTGNYIAGKDKIKLYRRSDFSDTKGGSVCRNIGLNIATGEFIIFLDADDLLLKHCLEHRILLAQSNFSNQLFIFHHAFFYSDPERHFQQRLHHQIHKIGFYLSRNKELFFLKRFLKYDLPWTISNALWEKTALLRIKGFDESLQRLQDPDLYTHALLNDIKVTSFQYRTAYDVLIRKVIDMPHVDNGDRTIKFRIYIDSIEKYVSKVSKQLEYLAKSQLKPYLNGYFFSAQANINYALINTSGDEKVLLKEKRKEIAVLQKKLIANNCRNHLYSSFLFLHRIFVTSKIARRLKLPAATYKLYMYVI